MPDSKNRSARFDILQLGDPALREQARKVNDFTCPVFQNGIAVMQKLMSEAGGVGIAAPQLGIQSQIVIVASRPTPRYPTAPEMAPIVMVNPCFEIVDTTVLKDWEGCLSVPGIRALVPRFRAVRVFYCDAGGKPMEIALEGFPARVFQHEYDHLLGLVYLDRVESNRDIIAESEFFKRMAA